MKKIIAVLLLLCLSLCSALAENAVNWADVEPTLAENGLEGGFVSIGDTGLMMWLPNGVFYDNELTDEQVSTGIVTLLTDAEAVCSVTVTCLDIGMTIDEYMDYLKQNDIADAEFTMLNGQRAVAYDDAEQDYKALSVFISDTAVVEFIFVPASDEGFASTVSIMAASIQPIA